MAVEVASEPVKTLPSNMFVRKLNNTSLTIKSNKKKNFKNYVQKTATPNCQKIRPITKTTQPN
jgi:hypothetical protein